MVLEFEKYNQLANSGDALAQYRLGFCYDTGFGVTVNREKALALYCESAKQNCKEAKNIINSIIDEFDEEYVLILSKCASKEIADKLHDRVAFLSEEGDRYYFGRDREHSYEKALEYYKKTALFDNLNAIYSLGFCYRYGQGTKIDEKTAFSYFFKGSELNDINCRIELAKCYLEGFGTEANVNKGAELLFSVISKDKIPSILEKYENADDEIVFRLNEKAFQKGYSDSVKILCKCYLEGRGTEQNIEKAISLLGKGLLDEELYGMAGELQFSDNDVTGEKTCFIFKKLAELGMTKAQDKYGYCLMFGDGIEKNEPEAIIWYKKAADAGYPEALYHLGWCYMNGCGVDKDKYTAISYFKKSANMDFEDAEYEIGRIYYEGDGVRCDYNVAFPMIKKAADKGNTKSLLLLAKCYLYGYGVDKHVYKSYEIFNSIANEEEAQYYIGYCNYYGLGTIKNTAEAKKWLERIKDNNLKAYSLFFKIEEEQKKVYDQENSNQYFNDAFKAAKENDYERAFELYKKAAEVGHVGAQNNLAILYKNGQGCDKSVEQAVYWYKKSADGGNLIAKSNLAHLYYTGDGVDKSYERAFKLFFESASTELLGTFEKLGECFELGRGVKKDVSQAFEWYKKAAEKNSKIGQFKLALFFEKGIGRDVDLNESKRWLDKAIEQKYGPAKFRKLILDRKIAILNRKQEIEKSIKEMNYYSPSLWRQLNRRKDKTPLQVLIEFADDGVLDAQLFLSECYLKGKGRWVRQDSTAAYKYKKMAADQNHVESQYEMAIHIFPSTLCLKNGSAKKEDIENGLSYFRKAATNGHIGSMLRLGEIYSDISSLHSYELAKKYYSLAINKSNGTAEYRLKEIENLVDYEGLIYQYNPLSQNFSLIKSYEKNKTEYFIPAYINFKGINYYVEEIETSAFDDLYDLKRIKVGYNFPKMKWRKLSNRLQIVTDEKGYVIYERGSFDGLLNAFGL